MQLKILGLYSVERDNNIAENVEWSILLRGLVMIRFKVLTKQMVSDIHLKIVVSVNCASNPKEMRSFIIFNDFRIMSQSRVDSESFEG
jgi:hypothetical protein